MKKLVLVLLIVLSCTMLTNCKKKEKHTPVPDPIEDNYRVFYEIFVGSFSDSNGDGKGDLRGIINRLDYLNDGDITSGKSLGIQGIWLTPIFKSGTYHKYDCINYRTIDEDFGTMDDLVELINKCHERNIKVILDLVLNHTSSSNKWFTKFHDAREHEYTDNQYYDYYTCILDKADAGTRRFNKLGSTKYYYECNFDDGMPELNYDNENVRQEVLDIAKYYLELGVDGFRFDAAKYIYFGDSAKNVEFWKWYISELKKVKPDIYTVGEIWSSDPETLPYVEALNCFNFQMSGAEGYIGSAAKGGNLNIYTSYIEKYQKQVLEKNPEGMMIPFISNHDMDRSAGYLTMALNHCYMGANLYLLAPGSPFIYYGEEIGLKGTRGTAMTDANRRLAMLWGDDDKVSDPVGTTYNKGKQTNGTVKEQLEDSESLLNYYCKVISIRNKYPEIARGMYKSIQTDVKAGGFEISYNNELTYLFHNATTKEVSIDLSKYNISSIKDYIGMDSAKLEGTTLIIGPQTSVILK